MKPKLIILNGSLGIGKSTLAKRYADNRPLTLQLDIDNLWAMISHWRERKDISALLSKQMAVEMARINLLAGNDVIVPQIIQTTELADTFKALASECAADYYEVLLFADKQNAIERFIERGKSQGSPNGFRAGGIIDRSGREDKLAQMYDDMMLVANNRPNTIKLEPILGDIDGTYSALLKVIQ